MVEAGEVDLDDGVGRDGDVAALDLEVDELGGGPPGHRRDGAVEPQGFVLYMCKKKVRKYMMYIVNVFVRHAEKGGGGAHLIFFFEYTCCVLPALFIGTQKKKKKRDLGLP